MDFSSIINRIYIFVSCLNVCVSFSFLILAFFYRRRCFNFPTLLACNTALGIFLHAVVHVAISVYMSIWDQYEVFDIDPLCSLRAYFHHSAAAWIHHSLVLQAIQRYCKIRRLTFLKNRRRKICLILLQWIFDFTFGLPAFVTNSMTKMSSENVCFVTLTKLHFVIYMAVLSFLLTDITLSIIYRSLVRHVRQVSARLDQNQQTQTQRDLTMVRRIVLLNSQLVLTGIPVLIFVILVTIRADLLPNKFMRVLLLLTNLPLSPLLIILFSMTPDLRHSLIECRHKLRRLILRGKITPVLPISTVVRF